MLVQSVPFTDKRIDAAWLRRARWVAREQGSGTRSTLDRHLRTLGVDPSALDIALVLPSNESVRCGSVLAGRCARDQGGNAVQSADQIRAQAVF
jgi:hypothetical protein